MECRYSQQGLFIGSTSTGDTQVAMCCWQNKRTFEASLKYHDSYLLQLRQEFAQGQLPTQCSTYCAIPGHGANEREWALKDTTWPTDSDNRVVKLHLEQSLTCNLKCIICGPQYSSAWNTDYHHFDKTYPLNRQYRNPERVWSELDFSALTHLHFTGGEPLLNADNKKILQHLDAIGRLGDVCISYNTNATVFPDSEILELWSRARWIRLFLSLDGTESTFEYTRYPAKWSQVSENISRFQSIKQSCIMIEVTFIAGIHNIFDLPNFLAWWENSDIAGSQGDVSQIFIKQVEPSSHGGASLLLRNLPVILRSKVIDMLKNFVQYRGVQDLIDEIAIGEENMAWLEYLTKLDEIRQTDFRTQLPSQLSQYF
jgi:hypothetical protein